MSPALQLNTKLLSNDFSWYEINLQNKIPWYGSNCSPQFLQKLYSAVVFISADELQLTARPIFRMHVSYRVPGRTAPVGILNYPMVICRDHLQNTSHRQPTLQANARKAAHMHRIGEGGYLLLTFSEDPLTRGNVYYKCHSWDTHTHTDWESVRSFIGWCYPAIIRSSQWRLELIELCLFAVVACERYYRRNLDKRVISTALHPRSRTHIALGRMVLFDSSTQLHRRNGRLLCNSWLVETFDGPHYFVYYAGWGLFSDDEGFWVNQREERTLPGGVPL